MSLGDTRVLPRWGPAYRQHDLDLGSRLERAKARLETAAGVTGVVWENPERQKPRGAEYRRRGAGADRPVVAMKPGNAGGATGAGYPDSNSGQPPCGRSW